MNSFGARSRLEVAGSSFEIFRLSALEQEGVRLAKLPFALKILLENVLRNEGANGISAEDALSIGKWSPTAEPTKEIAFTPARVLLQDFTGVPCVVDLAAMRQAMARLQGDPQRINPLQPVELVIDHSVQVDAYGSSAALQINLDLEFERNRERYEFLKWGQLALDNFKVVPPNTGICHQVNLEYLARVVMTDGGRAFPDTVVGTDSHTTMINGLGVLGWGVGGIEAEAAMLGQPVSMLLPQVVGFRLSGSLPEGSTATDLVLTVTEMLRKHGVVGKFVEYFGPGLSKLPLADRATLGNMSPEYGATCGIFPVDEETLRYLRFTGRSAEQVALVEGYMKEQGLFHSEGSEEPEYSSVLHLDLSTVEPSVAGPKRPQDRVRLASVRESFVKTFSPVLATSGAASVALSSLGQGEPKSAAAAVMDWEGPESGDSLANGVLSHGSIVIAAITSCTNTSNPSVMVAAGLVAKRASELGLRPKPWVKTSLAPGSKVVKEYLEASGLQNSLDRLGFQIVGFGCTTCIGNSGPLPEEVSRAIAEKDLIVAAVLSGNRNFEGRVNQEVKANYLMSPPLVVAYALAGTINIDLTRDAIGLSKSGSPVYIKDIWPTQQEVAQVIESALRPEMFRDSYASVFEGDALWNAIGVTGSELFPWDPSSTYVKEAPYFDAMTREEPNSVASLEGLRCLAVLGDSITTDHISPAGAIKLNSPAGAYLTANGVQPHLFNSYGSRRGNHEVMVRGTFANVRLRNELAPGTEGGWTTHLPSGEVMSIFEASERYREAGTALYVLAGKEYGSGSSRDWAAKGPSLLGVKVVIAESYERIHRSNLVGMGVLPLQFLPGESRMSLGLTGDEQIEVMGLKNALESGFANGKSMEVQAVRPDGTGFKFGVIARIDTPQEIRYYRNGGILPYVLRQLLKD